MGDDASRLARSREAKQSTCTSPCPKYNAIGINPYLQLGLPKILGIKPASRA